VTTGTVLAMSASSRQEDIENLISYRSPDGTPASFGGTVRERYDDLVAEGEQIAGFSKAAFVAAGLSAAAAVAFFLLQPDSERAPAAARITPQITAVGVAVTYDLRF
jgi:hypothetical protein